MPLERKQTTIVVIANRFNPSILTDHWMIRNGILNEGEAAHPVHTPPFTQYDSGDWQIVAMEERLQLLLKTELRAQEFASRVISGIVRLLPETPYKAVGMNWQWEFMPSEESASEFCQRLFRPPVADTLKCEQARFGTVISMPYNGGTKTIKTTPTSESSLKFDFNYHFDLSTDHAVDDITRSIDSWGQTKDDMRNTLTLICGEELQ